MNSQMYDQDRTDSFRQAFDQFTGPDPAATGENPFEAYNRVESQEQSQGGYVDEDSQMKQEEDNLFKFN